MGTSEILNKMMDKPKDPYRKICEYIHCQKEFNAGRQNQEYCCPEIVAIFFYRKFYRHVK